MVEENIVQNQIINQATEIQSQPAKPWLRIALFSVLGLVLAGGLVWAGTQIGKNSPLRQGFVGQAKLTPTPVPVAISTSTFPPETTPLPDETADWKTYTHSLGFSFKYPPNWQISSTTEPVVVGLMPETLKPTDEPFFALRWYENKNLLNPENFYEELEKNNQSGDPISPFRQEEPVIKKLQSGEVVYYFENIYCVATCRMAVWAYKGGIYEFIDRTKGLGTNYQQLVRDSDFDQILSTFRFLD